MTLYSLLRPLIFALDAETAHRLSLRALRMGVVPSAPAPDPRLRQSLLGLEFPHPVGLAAGYDKNAEVVTGAHALGFAFTEVGTVTPRPQVGNQRPRLFRLNADRAVINRLGFPNDGFDVTHARLKAPRTGIVGVNVGANRDSIDRAADYVAGVARFADIADYVAINVSSPNTAGLRDLQAGSALAELLARVLEAREAAVRHVPILLKLAPDLDDAGLGMAIEIAMAAGVDGFIVANTTLARDRLRSPAAGEAGGLSGPPLFRRSTVALAKTRRWTGKGTVIVGVGGVGTVDTAWQKLAAGADLMQLYTGMVYEGPTLAVQIVQGLAARLDREGVASISEIVGTETDRWAAMSV